MRLLGGRRPRPPEAPPDRETPGSSAAPPPGAPGSGGVRLALFLRGVDRLLRQRSPERVYSTVTESAARLLGVSYAAAYEWDPECRSFVLRSAVGRRPAGLGPGLSLPEIGSGRSPTLSDPSPALASADRPSSSRSRGGVLSVLVPGHDHPAGVLVVAHPLAVPFSREAVHAAEVLARVGGAALERITSRADRDRLSGLVDAVLRATSDAVIVVDSGGRVTHANAVAERLLGRLAPGGPARPVDLGHVPGEIRSLCARALQGREESAAALRLVLPTGAPLDLVASAAPLRDPGGRVRGAVVAAADVTAVRELRDAYAHFREVLESTTDIVAITNVPGSGPFLNRAARRVLGFGPDEAPLAFDLGEIYPPSERAVMVNQAFPQAIRDGGWSGETVILGRDGRETPVSQVVLAHRTPEGEVQGFSVIARDISERKRAEAHLAHLATHDPLTGLSNRRRFEEDLARHLAEARRYGTHGAVVLLDLDQFKEVNDALGHPAGDTLLCWVGAVVRGCLRDTDLVARMGGDEFAILLPHTDAASADALAQRLRTALARSPVALGGRPVSVTASLGVALFPDHGTTTSELLLHADAALYRVKARGRDGVAVYAPGETGPEADEDGAAWSRRLRAAVEQDGFRFSVLPTLDLRSNRITSYELLLRLVGEAGRLIPPRDFLGIAERSGLMPAIDRWVIGRAIRLVAEERRRGGDLRVVVNLSGPTLADPGLLRFLEEELGAHGVAPSHLAIEVSEEAAVAHMASAVPLLREVVRLGCRCGLDDVGWGFAWVALLRDLRVDYLKVDGAFVRDLVRRPQDRRIVQALVALARMLEAETIAEFVGDGETVRVLRRYGVDGAQGSYIRSSVLPAALREAPDHSLPDERAEPGTGGGRRG